LECVAHECPQLLINDFRDLFPSTCRVRPEILKRLTVITLCQKTKNDQSAWTSDLEDERDELIGQFVESAQNMCELLQEAGYWADFIDPASGRFYLGPYTPATMFETDERYRHFGFTIEDLGCCKVLRHHQWGTKSFVGAVFTSAPLDAPELASIMNSISGGE
jgi:Methylmalonic aciduria and homocystinuria type D protein